VWPLVTTCVVALAGCTDNPPADVTPPPSATPLGQAIASVGDPTAVAGLQGLAIDATGTTSSYDEGVDPAETVVPFSSSDFKVATSIDVMGNRLRLVYDRTYQLIRPGTMAHFVEVADDKNGFVVGDDRVTGGVAGYVAPMASARVASTRRQQLLLNPHLLLRGLAETDVTAAGTADLGGRPQRRLVIKDPDRMRAPDSMGMPAPMADLIPVRDIELLVDQASGRLSALTTRENDHLRGDVNVRVVYDQWQASGTLFFPRRVSIEVDGRQVRVEERTAVLVNPAFAGDLFSLPPATSPAVDETELVRGARNAQSYQRFVAMGVGSSTEVTHNTVKALEIGTGTGIYHLTGSSHHSLLIDQGQTVVLVDAPNDAGRSKAILDWIDKTLPGGLAENRVSHVILTHHHVDHTAGLRTFIAQGAVAVIGEESRALWNKVLASSRTIEPDDLVGKTITPNLMTVKMGESVTLGNVVAYHIASSHAADVLAIRVTSQGSPPVLFVTDIYIPSATSILPKSNFVKWSKELDDALTALKINDDGMVILGGHGNVDSMGNHFNVSYGMFKSQLGAAMAP
jgi:glyoxylase-like metal-dependent hydrolase (beta-lactamase superfamily II)